MAISSPQIVGRPGGQQSGNIGLGILAQSAQNYATRRNQERISDKEERKRLAEQLMEQATGESGEPSFAAAFYIDPNLMSDYAEDFGIPYEHLLRSEEEAPGLSRRLKRGNLSVEDLKPFDPRRLNLTADQEAGFYTSVGAFAEGKGFADYQPTTQQQQQQQQQPSPSPSAPASEGRTSQPESPQNRRPSGGQQPQPQPQQQQAPSPSPQPQVDAVSRADPGLRDYDPRERPDPLMLIPAVRDYAIDQVISGAGIRGDPQKAAEQLVDENVGNSFILLRNERNALVDAAMNAIQEAKMAEDPQSLSQLALTASKNNPFRYPGGGMMSFPTIAERMEAMGRLPGVERAPYEQQRAPAQQQQQQQPRQQPRQQQQTPSQQPAQEGVRPQGQLRPEYQTPRYPTNQTGGRGESTFQPTTVTRSFSAPPPEELRDASPGFRSEAKKIKSATDLMREAASRSQGPESGRARQALRQAASGMDGMYREATEAAGVDSPEGLRNWVVKQPQLFSDGFLGVMQMQAEDPARFAAIAPDVNAAQAKSIAEAARADYQKAQAELASLQVDESQYSLTVRKVGNMLLPAVLGGEDVSEEDLPEELRPFYGIGLVEAATSALDLDLKKAELDNLKKRGTLMAAQITQARAAAQTKEGKYSGDYVADIVGNLTDLMQEYRQSDDPAKDEILLKVFNRTAKLLPALEAATMGGLPTEATGTPNLFQSFNEMIDRWWNPPSSGEASRRPSEGNVTIPSAGQEMPQMPGLSPDAQRVLEQNRRGR